MSNICPHTEYEQTTLFVADFSNCPYQKDLHFVWRISVDTITPSDVQKTYDLLLSPSFLNPSMILAISFLPSLASYLWPPILMLTFSLLLTCNNRFKRRCLMLKQTNTPQSELFACCGESSRSMKRSGRNSRWESLAVTWWASALFPGGNES